MHAGDAKTLQIREFPQHAQLRTGKAVYGEQIPRLIGEQDPVGFNIADQIQPFKAIGPGVPAPE